MPYQIEFSKRAAKQFKTLSLSPQLQDRIKFQISALAENPRPSGVTKLEGQDSQYRRIVYQIQDSILLVILLRIGHGKNDDSDTLANGLSCHFEIAGLPRCFQ